MKRPREREWNKHANNVNACMCLTSLTMIIWNWGVKRRHFVYHFNKLPYHKDACHSLCYKNRSQSHILYRDKEKQRKENRLFKTGKNESEWEIDIGIEMENERLLKWLCYNPHLHYYSTACENNISWMSFFWASRRFSFANTHTFYWICFSFVRVV